MSSSLWPHEMQHARPPCPLPTPGVHSNSCPSSLWCHQAISSSVVPFSSCPQSHPASWSFPVSQLFAWGGQSTGVSASASVLPKKSQDWSPLEWTGWISYASLPPFKKQNSKESVYPKTWQVVKSTFIWFTAAVWLQKPCPWHPTVLPTVVPYLCALSCIILWQNLTDPILFYALPCFKRTGDPLCKYMDQISIF